MAFASWQRYCTVLQRMGASAKLCGVEQRAPPIFDRAAIALASAHILVVCVLLLFLHLLHVNQIARQKRRAGCCDRSAAIRLYDLWQSFQAQTSPDGARPPAQRRKTVPLWTLPQDVQSFWLVFTAHEEPVQVLQAAGGAAAAASVDDGVHVSSGGSSRQQCCRQWHTQRHWRHVFRCGVRRHLGSHSLSVLSVLSACVQCFIWLLLSFRIAHHGHTFDVADESISITWYFQYRCLPVHLITVCNCL